MNKEREGGPGVRPSSVSWPVALSASSRPPPPFYIPHFMLSFLNSHRLNITKSFLPAESFLLRNRSCKVQI